MIMKTDGGFNYDTTDMAAIRYRIDEKKVDWIIYITDSGQAFHFKLIFEGAKIVGFLDPAKTRVDHMAFGLVLKEATEEEEVKVGEVLPSEAVKEVVKATEATVVVEEKKEEVKEMKKPQANKKGKEQAPKKKVEKIKTREGKSVKLMELLDEAKKRAFDNYKERMTA
jgi:arginyl-tRNA synthetase